MVNGWIINLINDREDNLFSAEDSETEEKDDITAASVDSFYD